MSGPRRPFLNVHRLGVLSPVWVFGLGFGVPALAAVVMRWWGYDDASAYLLVGPLIIALVIFQIPATRCPKCGAFAMSWSGDFWWGPYCAFFAHEECPRCGLDLCAVTPWGSGVRRQRLDWIAALPQPRKFWIQTGAVRILLMRVAVVYLLFWVLPPAVDAARRGLAAMGL